MVDIEQGRTIESAREPGSRVHLRQTFRRTQRDGWGYEDSIEVSSWGPETRDLADLLKDLDALTEASRLRGMAECERRNALDGADESV